MTMIPRVADCANPELIPDMFAQWPNGIFVPVNGDWKWNPDQVNRFPRRITVTVMRDQHNVSGARVMDIERGDAKAVDCLEFVKARRSHGKYPIVLCDRSSVASVQIAMGANTEFTWIISCPDNVFWNPEALAHDLLMIEHVSISPAAIFGIQDQGIGPYDVTRIFHHPDWLAK
jgi:hypothetical protein